MIIIQSQRLKSHIIRTQGLPHSTTYRKINELIKYGLLVLYRSEIACGKKIAYYKSTFRSITVSYQGITDTKIEAEPNQDALERISSRFYDLKD